MIPVIERYVSREIFQTLLGVSVVLLLIFVSNRLVRYLADAASGDIPTEIIFTLIGLKSIKYFILLVPLAMYLSILLVLGRLYRDNEMSAFSACGIGFGKLYKIILMSAVPAALLLSWVSLKVIPTTAQIEHKVIINAEQDLEVTGVRAGRFSEASGGERIIYVESVSKDNTSTKNVFIHAKIHSRHVVFSAAVARIENNPLGERYLILENGYRYDGVPGQADYRMTRFQEHAFKLVSKLRGDDSLKQDAIPTSVLWKSNNPKDIAEMQWRIAVPLSTIFLALLAVPIGRVKPRQGRYGKLVVAMLFYVIYFYLLSTSRAWVAQGTLSPLIGLWWAHGFILILTLLMLAKQVGYRWLLNPSGQVK